MRALPVSFFACLHVCIVRVPLTLLKVLGVSVDGVFVEERPFGSTHLTVCALECECECTSVSVCVCTRILTWSQVLRLGLAPNGHLQGSCIVLVRYCAGFRV